MIFSVFAKSALWQQDKREKNSALSIFTFLLYGITFNYLVPLGCTTVPSMTGTSARS